MDWNRMNAKFITPPTPNWRFSPQQAIALIPSSAMRVVA